MSSSAKAEAVLALHRFGLGPRPGSIAAIGADPRGALIAELERASAMAIPGLSSAKAFRAVNDANAKRQAKAILAKKEQDAKRQQMAEAPSMQAPSMTEGSTPEPGEMAQKVAADAVPDPGRQIYLEEARIRTEAAFGAEIGFVERLVWSRSNHFSLPPPNITNISRPSHRH